jgi:ABC-2 type transport system ATP-binding protein
VDLELRTQLWSYVRGLNRQGTTVVLTTHYLEEAQAMCDRIAIIDKGALVAHDTTSKLLARIEDKQLVIRPQTQVAALPVGLVAYRAELKPTGELMLTYRPSETRLDTLIDAVRATGIVIADLSTVEPDLEDVFLQLTRKIGNAAD